MKVVKNSIIQRMAGASELSFVLVLGLWAVCLFERNLATAADRNTADVLAGIVADEKALPTVRLDALKTLFKKHFKPQGTLAETADFFKHCRWIKKGDWQVVGGIAGVWPFEETSPFSATPFRTKLVAVRMRPAGSVENGIGMVWLGFPVGHEINESEIEMILSGKCPERLEKLRLLDGKLEFFNPDGFHPE